MKHEDELRLLNALERIAVAAEGISQALAPMVERDTVSIAALLNEIDKSVDHVACVLDERMGS